MTVIAACYLIITASASYLAIEDDGKYIDAYTGEEIVTEGELPNGVPLPVNIVELPGCGEREE